MNLYSLQDKAFNRHILLVVVVIGMGLLSPAKAQAESLTISNPGFEDGESDWSWSKTDKKLNLSQVTENAAHSGKYGLHVAKEGDNAGSSVTSSRIDVKAGKNYTLNYWVHSITPGSAAVYMRFLDGQGHALPAIHGKSAETLQMIPNKAGAWKSQSLSAVAPDNAMFLEIWIHATTIGVVEVDFDDFTLNEE